MACEQHRDAMTKAALGELHPKDELELLQHAGECDICREAYNHAQQMRAGIDHAIEALIAAEPSPHFISRLRARIAAEPAPVRMHWHAWTPIATGALAILVLLAVWVLHLPESNSPQLAVAVPSPAASSTAPSNSATESSPPVPPRIAKLQNRPAHSPVLHARTPSLDARVLVPRGQLAAAFELGDAVSQGRLDANHLATVSQADEQPLEVKPLDVPPLEKLAPIDDAPDPAGRL
jgi:hypothetical protein